MYESLQSTQSQIEQWIVDPAIIPPDAGPVEPREEPDICYGTVGEPIPGITQIIKKCFSFMASVFSYAAI